MSRAASAVRRPGTDTAARVTGELIDAWFDRFRDRLATEHRWLTQLDTAIGDADHGAVVRCGAEAVIHRRQVIAPRGVGLALRESADAFGSAAGGAGGILLTTFLREAAASLGNRLDAPLADFAAALAHGVRAVQERGRADAGDKTMVDALLPAVHALGAPEAGEGLPMALRRAARAASAGRDSTFALVARRGRASYLGDRSADHLDPGAATAAILFAALAAAAEPPHPDRRKTTMSTDRQFINQPADVIAEALEGLASTHPTLLRLDAEHSLISRSARASGKVGLLSGGGSGHEPLHAGFVGVGMLDVAVAGAVFASPTAQQVQAGTRLADSGAGVLHIVKNYTGDVLNFEIAAELAADDGGRVERVLVDDDLASDGSGDGPGRRGTAAVITVEKVCGALAERGADLATVAAAGADVVSRSRTLALTLDGCTHPGDADPAFRLGADEVEFGVGIHGERGTARIPFGPADELTEKLVMPLVESLGLTRGQGVIAIVNGLGGTYPLELSIVARRMHRLLDSRGIPVARSLVGSYVTSLDMHGVSITLTVASDDIVQAWDAPVRTAALSW